MSQEPSGKMELVVHCLCGSTDVEIYVTHRLPHVGAVAPLRYHCLACGQESVDPAGRTELWQLVVDLARLEQEYMDVEARHERA